jgi:spermidine/putrescine transport system ATP-binding protein
VADFIGTTNLLSGTVASVTADGAILDLDAGGFCVVGADGLAPGAAVEIAVRPEALELIPRPAEDTAAADDAAGSWLRGTVEQSAYLGTSINYQVRMDVGQRVVASVPRTHGRISAGTPVEIRWRPEDTLVLGRPAGPENEQEEPR